MLCRYKGGGCRGRGQLRGREGLMGNMTTMGVGGLSKGGSGPGIEGVCKIREGGRSIPTGMRAGNRLGIRRSEAVWGGVPQGEIRREKWGGKGRRYCGLPCLGNSFPEPRGKGRLQAEEQWRGGGRYHKKKGGIREIWGGEKN